MSNKTLLQILSPYTRYILFGLGAVLGSAFGLVIGSVLTFWLGEGTVRMVQRAIRRIGGSDDHPSFELLMQ
jgi:hypothetical protein